MKDDFIAFIGGVSLGLWIGISICEIVEKRKKKKSAKRA